ncbi:MAG: prephenate dehydrogenase/arogenate dehydrogenase family protein [Bryobacteraceae bacterium]|nr:prephenate dehydrogenase/arogenate dehydrogenase family protein [Bryobacteraceae bacterium]
MRFRKVAILGVGLLGGSLGLALRRRGLAGEVCGYVRRAASVSECRATGSVDVATTQLHEAVREADLVVLCTPVGQMNAVATAMLPALSPHALVTDVGSVKASVVSALEPLLSRAGAAFVGSHPMAGSEKNGVSAARPDLFENAVCIVTPTAHSPAPALARVEALWQAVGGRVLRLAPALHDELVSRASHLPQVLAASLATVVLARHPEPTQGQVCAGGFRDCTRIASGSPEMWRDILLANQQPVIAAIDEFVAGLGEVREAVVRGDAERVGAFLAAAKQVRDRWLGQNHGTAAGE